jgi:hypothetical protein
MHLTGDLPFQGHGQVDPNDSPTGTHTCGAMRERAKPVCQAGRAVSLAGNGASSAFRPLPEPSSDPVQAGIGFGLRNTLSFGV